MLTHGVPSNIILFPFSALTNSQDSHLYIFTSNVVILLLFVPFDHLDFRNMHLKLFNVPSVRFDA